MCVFEITKFAKGTNSIAKAIAANRKTISIIGGGDSVAAINKLKLEKKFTHVSTGGGASLEFLKGKKLPAVKVLKYKPVPPTRIGVFFLLLMSKIFLSTSFNQSPAEKFFLTF